LPNNIVILVTINKFNPNLVLVNINKLTPYRFIEDKTLHLVLAKPNDLITKKPFQINFFEPLLVENDIFEPIVFELVNDNLTNGKLLLETMYLFIIITTYLFSLMTYLFNY